MRLPLPFVEKIMDIQQQGNYLRNKIQAQFRVSEAAAPNSIRTLYGKLPGQQQPTKTGLEFKAKNITVFELRTREMMRQDRMANRLQTRIENQSKRDYFKRSLTAINRPASPKLEPVREAASLLGRGARNIAHSSLDTVTPSRGLEDGGRNTAPSPMQKANGYVARHTPWESPIATGPMGSLTNGLKPISEQLNALVGDGKQRGGKKLSALAAKISGRTHVVARPAPERRREEQTRSPKPRLREIVLDCHGGKKLRELIAQRALVKQERDQLRRQEKEMERD
jgi:hypothetical protein